MQVNTEIYNLDVSVVTSVKKARRCPEGYESYTNEGGFSMHLGVRGSSVVFACQGWEWVSEEQGIYTTRQASMERV